MGFKLACAKAISGLSTWGLKNIFRRPAANLPGKLALYIDSDVIQELIHKLDKGSLVVCGTNGKTTTNNLIADALERQGCSVICNRTGANLRSGIATALLHGKKSDWGVFECDELWLSKVLPQLQSNYLVLLNLFRDQLDRCGEIDYIQESIASGLRGSPQTTLIYNSDDPLCAAIAAKVDNPRIAFGVGESLKLTQNTVADAQMCQKCSGMLEYTYRQYGQLGEYHCPACGFSRGELDFEAKNVQLSTSGLAFNIYKAEQTEVLGSLKAPFSGAYMVYNLLAVYSAAHTVGCSDEVIQKAIEAFDPQNGRLQHFSIQDRSILLNLAKNPTGFNQNMKIILQDEGPKAVGFFVNDKEGDGRDISWIWDVDFEELAHDENLIVFAGGIRKNDLQVRLKYAGITSSLVDGAQDMLAKTSNLPESYKLYLIANYTALPPVHTELTQMEQAEGKG